MDPSPGHVGDGQFGGINPGMDVLPALLGERPFEGRGGHVLLLMGDVPALALLLGESQSPWSILEGLAGHTSGVRNEATAWWRRDAAERAGSGEEPGEGEEDPGLDEAEFRRRFAHLFHDVDAA